MVTIRVRINSSRQRRCCVLRCWHLALLPLKSYSLVFCSIGGFCLHCCCVDRRVRAQRLVPGPRGETSVDQALLGSIRVGLSEGTLESLPIFDVNAEVVCASFALATGHSCAVQDSATRRIVE